MHKILVQFLQILENSVELFLQELPLSKAQINKLGIMEREMEGFMAMHSGVGGVQRKRVSGVSFSKSIAWFRAFKRTCPFRISNSFHQISVS